LEESEKWDKRFKHTWEWIEAPKMVNDEIKGFLNNHFKDREEIKLQPDGPYPLMKIQNLNNNSIKEICKAVWDCEGRKSPRTKEVQFQFY